MYNNAVSTVLFKFEESNLSIGGVAVYRNFVGILVGEGVLLLGLILGWRLFNRVELLGTGSVVTLLMVFTLYSFRDPERIVPEGEDIVLSPADGRVVRVGEVSSFPYFKGRAKIVSVYLSPWDVHVNRVPVSGEVVFVDYRPGRFYPAFNRKASERNECTVVGIAGTMGRVYVKQIAGMVARRIVCRLRVGDRVHKGERFGMITFGSRVEVFLPRYVTLRVSVGERVKGGESIIGEVVTRGT